ncbi:hypothetical protein [Streptomyces chartreusis]|uniref:hypothetical protein n=1 Tax=Streptomyces chartreusis TaxID=1969 RepID=UPI0036549439
MVNFLDDQSDAKRFAALLADYDRRLRDLERTSKAAYTSVEGGTLDIYTEDGQLAGSVGVQPDGGIALVPDAAAAVPPPTPGAPVVSSGLASLVVNWDGWWDDANAPPTDFAAMQVHVAAAADFTPDVATLAAAITDVTGGSVTIAVDGYADHWVRLVALNTAGLSGAPSSAVSGKARQAVEQDLVDGMISELKLAENAVTAAKIALNAVTGEKILAGAVTTDKLVALGVTAEKIASLAITTDKLAALAVTADKLAANSVTATKILAGSIEAAHIKAGSITADRLAIVGGSNMLPDPSFEGAGGAALVAGQTYWSIASSGNGSSKSVQVNAVNGTAVIRTLTLATFPILAGQQIRLAVDINPSSDWNGASVRIYARWIDTAGNVTFGFVTNSSPTRASWASLAGIVTAPAGTVTAEIRLASYDATAGSVLFDNAAVQPVVSQVLIADGAITADKLDANAINGKTITGATVQTAASGPRVVMNASNFTGYGTAGNKIGIEPNDAYPFIYWTSDDGTNKAYINVSGSTAADANIGINSGSFNDGGTAYRWRTFFGKDFYAAERIVAATGASAGSRLLLGKDTASLSATPTGAATITGASIRAAGVFRADNISTGVATITPTPNTPTSVTLSGGSIRGTNFRGFVTPNSTVPGTQVTGVGCSSVTASGMTIWLTRTNNTATSVYWMIIGED